ncbi:MAG TPA: YdeI/OmpD-associated family protein, partial [Casimicrobiaceae bacterium]|nr:YdeI/OmpD-associated family protein [Casimicrobiaceae bacterium]
KGGGATMGTRDPRVDAYIERSASFAKPVLKHLRRLVHAACPEVVETIKWGVPSFEHKGPLCGMAAFKKHCAFGFRHALMRAETGGKPAEAMGQFGRVTTLGDLPRDSTLTVLIRKAAKLNASGIKAPRARTRKAPPVVPAVLAAALEKNRKARATFESFSDSHKREYVEWIAEAKRDETRAKRLATAIAWMAEGKSKEWRYLRK